MSERSLQISSANLPKAKAAFKGLGLSQEQFAAQLGITRKTLSNFLNGKPSDRMLFVQLCEKLKLDWQALVVDNEQSDDSDIDALVQKVRSRLSQKIERNYGKITLLNTKSRAIDQLYVEVYLLDKLPSKINWDESDWLKDYEPERDRLAIAERGNRETGITVVTKQGFERLVLLGRPGYGKTTFLRHLTLLCSRGLFRPSCIPVLMELRDLDDENLDLSQWIHAELGCVTPTDTETLLNQGRVLLLLDGLDEVPSEWQAKFQNKLRSFFRRNPMLPVIVTCRTQTTEFIPNGFECVEMAEFNPEQVKKFVEQWFDAKVSAEGANQSQRFLATLADNKSVAELMQTPLLLSLACQIFTDRGQLPTKRIELYEQGVDLLLNRWDDKRPGYGTIRRHCDSEVYKALTLEQRKDLLSYLAFEKFTHPQTLSNGKLNFILYKQAEIESLIAKKLNGLLDECRNLPALIEAQHGLLVARTYKTWSFSHLTFQEYFAAREIVTNGDYDRLIPHMAEPRWREVFLLTVGMMRKADVLLQSMKQGIDNLSAQDAKLQEFLVWLVEKSCSVGLSYSPVAIRAFYFACEFALAPDLSRVLDQTFCRAFYLDLDLDLDLDRTLYRNLDLARDFALQRIFYFEFGPNRDLHLEHVRKPDLNLARARALTRSSNPELYSKLKQLKIQLPDSSSKHLESTKHYLESTKHWWQKEGKGWCEELRTVMIDYRNIGHNWQLSKEQKQLLQQYYEANKLLVDCLNNARFVSPEVRQEIEDTLLLPIAEI
jgi:predicted NACHT family NTPase/DNA-binding XRE family transcriptional regulator